MISLKSTHTDTRHDYPPINYHHVFFGLQDILFCFCKLTTHTQRRVVKMLAVWFLLYHNNIICGINFIKSYIHNTCIYKLVRHLLTVGGRHWERISQSRPSRSCKMSPGCGDKAPSRPVGWFCSIQQKYNQQDFGVSSFLPQWKRIVSLFEAVIVNRVINVPGLMLLACQIVKKPWTQNENCQESKEQQIKDKIILINLLTETFT